MKRLLPFAALLCLLAACGRSGDAPSVPIPPPESTPAVMFSPTPDPGLEKLVWGENYTMADINFSKLPTEVSAEKGAEQGGLTFYLLNELPDQDISLYGFTLDSGPRVLLRGGSMYTCFGQRYAAAGARLAPPQHQWADLDGDGAEELAVIYTLGDGLETNTTELHIYEWDNGWSDHPFTPEDYGAILDDSLEFQFSGRTATLSYGRTEVSYPLGHGETGPLTLSGDYEDTAVFRLLKDKAAVNILLRLQSPSGPCVDVALVSADVTYDGERFRLRDIKLLAVGGV